MSKKIVETHNIFDEYAYKFSPEKHIKFKRGSLRVNGFYLILFIIIIMSFFVWMTWGAEKNYSLGKMIFALVLGAIALPGAWKRRKCKSKYGIEVSPEGLLLHSQSQSVIPWSDILEMRKGGGIGETTIRIKVKAVRASQLNRDFLSLFDFISRHSPEPKTVAFNTTIVKVDYDQFFELLEKYWQHWR